MAEENFHNIAELAEINSPTFEELNVTESIEILSIFHSLLPHEDSWNNFELKASTTLARLLFMRYKSIIYADVFPEMDHKNLFFDLSSGDEDGAVTVSTVYKDDEEDKNVYTKYKQKKLKKPSKMMKQFKLIAPQIEYKDIRIRLNR